MLVRKIRIPAFQGPGCGFSVYGGLQRTPRNYSGFSGGVFFSSCFLLSFFWSLPAGLACPGAAGCGCVVGVASGLAAGAGGAAFTVGFCVSGFAAGGAVLTGGFCAAGFCAAGLAGAGFGGVAGVIFPAGGCGLAIAGWPGRAAVSGFGAIVGCAGLAAGADCVVWPGLPANAGAGCFAAGAVDTGATGLLPSEGAPAVARPGIGFGAGGAGLTGSGAGFGWATAATCWP